jgi:hypothetical protein
MDQSYDRKRRHDSYSSEDFLDYKENGLISTPENLRSTRERKRARSLSPGLNASHEQPRGPSYVIIHTVSCSNDDYGNHRDHPKASYFLDQPQLFKGDNRTSSLRGKIPIHNVGDYLEDNENIGIVIYRQYDCQIYHKMYDDKFERLRLPMDSSSSTRDQLRPYLHILAANTASPLPLCLSE